MRGQGRSLKWSRYECNFFGPICPGMKFMHHVAQKQIDPCYMVCGNPSSTFFHVLSPRPSAGSRSIFGPFYQIHFSKRVSWSRFEVLLYLISNDITLCLWSGFISPRIRTFVEKHFHSLFSKKKALKSGGVPSFLSWSWGQLPPQRKPLQTRLPGLLEKRSKIWRYGRSWKLVWNNESGKVVRKLILLPA